MIHDRTRISALVDSECDVDERETVLAHVMGCDDCRAFYRHEQAAKTAVAGDPASDRGAPVGLVAALLALGPASPQRSDGLRAGAGPGRSVRSTGSSGPSGSSGSTGPGRPGELPGQRRRRLRRAAKGLAFSVLGAGLVCAIAFVVGGDTRPSVAVVQLTAFGAAHARAEAARDGVGESRLAASTKRAGTEAASLVLAAPASAPAAALGTFALVTTQEAEGVVASTYRDGSALVSVFRQPGRLETKNLQGFSTHRLDGAKVHRRLGTPTYQVWSCQDVTYTVVGDSATGVDEVSSALPHVCPERTGWGRVGHGMHRAAGWLNPIS